MERNLSGRVNKRRFLELTMLAVAGTTLAACSQAAPASPTAAPAAPATSAPSQPTAAATAAPTAAAAAPTTAAAAPAQPTVAPTAAAAAAPAATSSGTPVKGGILTYAEAGDFNDFNPWGFGAVNFEMYDQVFSRLLWKDGTGKANPDLGESWETSSDNKSFTVKLRTNATWHDGKPVTASDIVTMYGYLKDPVISQYPGTKKIAGLFGPVTDVKAVDDHTVQFLLSKPVPYITDILDYFFLIRITDKNDPKFLKSLPVGTGPFKMTQWVPSQFAKFDRFPNYFTSGQPYLDTFMFKRLGQAETLVPNLRSGTVQDVLLSSLSDVAPLQADSSYSVVSNENSGSIFMLLVNSHKPPFDKKEVRQAFSYSMNREGMAKSAFFGVSKPITSPFYSPASLAYDEKLVMAHPFDLAKAKSLLSQAGVSNLQVEIHPTPAWPQMKLFCLIWQEDLAKIGVKMTVQEVESAKFYDIGGDPQLQGFYLHPWIVARTTRDPAIFFATQTPYRGDSQNVYGYKNDQLTQLINQGAVETDQTKRRQIYQQTNQILVDDTPMIQVATNPRIWAATNKLKDVDIDLNGNLFLSRAWLAK